MCKYQLTPVSKEDLAMRVENGILRGKRTRRGKLFKELAKV